MASQTQNFRMRIRQNASLKEKTLIRVVAETLKKLVNLYQIKSAEEILTSLDIQALRYKLKECLSRLMFLEPLEFGQKAEDTIWKSIFYEPIRIFKKELKNKPNVNISKSMLFVGFKRHILSAIGYYQKLIMRLQTEYDFMGTNYPNFGQTFEIKERDPNKEVSPALKLWSFNCIQHCLMIIGDLYRYEHDIKSPHSRSLAIRYYNLVLQLNPSLGHAYNQLATLDTLSYYGLNAAYYYLKAQLCTESFVQAKDNLEILFERNIKRLRSVIDRESIMKKSGSNVSRGGLKVLRVKSCIIKYLNLWHKFSISSDLDNHEAKQLAMMCDEVLNNLSYVLGFDRKLVSESGPVTGVRPSSLNCQTVGQILFIAHACLELMWQRKDGDEERGNMAMFDLAHSLTLNLYGHVFNQCLVRIRDEIKAANIDISILFRRYNHQAETGSVTNEDGDEVLSSSEVLVATDKPKRRKKTLSKRLVRVRHDTGEDQSAGDDLSEDEKNVWDNDNVLWEDQLSSDSSESDGGGKRFGFSTEEETEFESEEEIHSQDEDDQIIRAIVGSGTVFGRQQSIDKEAKRVRSKETEKGGISECGVVRSSDGGSVMYSDPMMPDSVVASKKVQRTKQRVSVTSEMTEISPHNKTLVAVVTQSQSLIQSIHNIDLLQSLTVFARSMHHLASTTSSASNDSFHRVWHSAPYLWKHFAVLLNFCENLLDDVATGVSGDLIQCASTQDTDTQHIGCTHTVSDPRKMVAATLPEDQELKGSSLALDQDDGGSVTCTNHVHQVVTRLNRLIQCGHTVSALTNGPLMVHKNGTGHLWLFSYSHNSPRANLVSKAWTQISSSHIEDTQGVCTGANQKEKMMREMARLRLENELSSNSDADEAREMTRSQSRSGGGDNGGGGETSGARSVYLVPDVNVLCDRLDMIKSLVRSHQFIIVVPQAVIQRLDRRKTSDHAARQVIKYFEAEMQLNNEHIKIETATQSRSPDLACDLIPEWAAIETTAVRLAKTASMSSKMSGCDVVVTIVTDKASLLTTSFTGHYAALRVDFQMTMD